MHRIYEEDMGMGKEGEDAARAIRKCEVQCT